MTTATMNMTALEERRFKYAVSDVSDQGVAPQHNHHNDDQDRDEGEEADHAGITFSPRVSSRRNNRFLNSVTVDDLLADSGKASSKHSSFLRQSLTLGHLQLGKSCRDEFGVSDMTLESGIFQGSSLQSIQSLGTDSFCESNTDTEHSSKSTRKNRKHSVFNPPASSATPASSRRQRCTSTNSSTQRFRSQAAKAMSQPQKVRPASLSTRVPRCTKRLPGASRSNTPPQKPDRQDSISSISLVGSLTGRMSRTLKSVASSATDSTPRYPVRMASHHERISMKS